MSDTPPPARGLPAIRHPATWKFLSPEEVARQQGYLDGLAERYPGVAIGTAGASAAPAGRRPEACATAAGAAPLPDPS